MTSCGHAKAMKQQRRVNSIGEAVAVGDTMQGSKGRLGDAGCWCGCLDAWHGRCMIKRQRVLPSGPSPGVSSCARHMTSDTSPDSDASR